MKQLQDRVAVITGASAFEKRYGRERCRSHSTSGFGPAT